MKYQFQIIERKEKREREAGGGEKSIKNRLKNLLCSLHDARLTLRSHSNENSGSDIFRMGHCHSLILSFYIFM